MIKLRMSLNCNIISDELSLVGTIERALFIKISLRKMSFCILSNYQTEYKQKRLLILEKNFKKFIIIFEDQLQDWKRGCCKGAKSLHFAISMLLYVGLLLTINHYRPDIDIL